MLLREDLLSLGVIQNSAEQGPEQPDPTSKVALPSTAGWTRRPPEVPCYLNYSVILGDTVSVRNDKDSALG